MDTPEKPREEKKGFFAKLMDKLDKKLEAKAQAKGSCCSPKKDGKDSCCGS